MMQKKKTVVDSRLDTSQTVKVHNMSPYFVKLFLRLAFWYFIELIEDN